MNKRQKKLFFYFLCLLISLYFIYINYSSMSIKILSWNILADEFIKKRDYPKIPPMLLLNRKNRQKAKPPYIASARYGYHAVARSHAKRL